MKNDLISIIIPVFNKEFFLERCLESVLKQTYRNIEVILIDDGSTDKSKDICDSYASQYKRVKTVHKNNGGVSSARNLGIDYANGSYIIFVDADDVVSPNYVEILYHYIINSDVDIIMCGLKEVHYRQGKEFVVNKQLERNEGNILNDFSSIYYNPNIFMGGVYLKIYSTEIIKENKVRYRENISFGEDYVFNLEYFEHIKTYGLIPDILYTYYCYPRNGSAQKIISAKRIKSEIAVMKFTKDYLIKHKLSEKILLSEIIRILRSFLTVICSDEEMDFVQKYRFYKEILKVLKLDEYFSIINSATNIKQLLVLGMMKNNIKSPFFCYCYLITMCKNIL